MDKIAELATSVRATFRRLRLRLLSESPPDGITPSQRSVLVALVEKAAWTQTELAAHEHVRPQSIGATVAALEDMGLVTRISHKRDGRCVLIKITASGRRLLRAGREHRNSWLMRTLSKELTAPERERLALALPLFEKLIDAE